MYLFQQERLSRMEKDLPSTELLQTFTKILKKGPLKKLLVRLGLKDEKELEETLQSLKSLRGMESVMPEVLLFIKGNHFPVVRFLIKEFVKDEDIGQTAAFVWKGMEYVDVPPLFAAILSDQTTHLEIINFLIDEDLLNDFPAVIDPILQSITIPRLQKIDMLELMGAAYILRSYQGKGSQFGLLCWKHAMILRQSTEDKVHIPKIQDISERNKKIFENVTEISTLEQVDGFLRDLTTNPRNSQLLHLLEAQAVLVTHRILSRTHPEPNLFFLHYFHYYTKQRFLVKGKASCLFDASMFALEPFESRDWKDVEDAADKETFGNIFFYLMLMPMTFHHMEQLPPNDPDREMLTVDNLFKIVRYVCAYVDKRDTDHLKRDSQHILRCAFEIIPLLVEKLRQHIQQPDQQIQESIKKYIKDVDKLPGVRTLIHLLVSSSPEVPIDVLQLLLKAKANPNSVDCKGDTPLHYLSHNFHCDNVNEAVKVLVDAGAHLNQENSFGESALEFFKQMQQTNVEHEGIANEGYNFDLQLLINSATTAILPQDRAPSTKNHGLKRKRLRSHRCRCDLHLLDFF